MKMILMIISSTKVRAEVNDCVLDYRKNRVVMVVLKVLFLGVIGSSAGVLVACGLCAFITMIGVMTRISWKTKTMDKIGIYENCMIVSAVAAAYLYLLMPNFHLNQAVSSVILAIEGLFIGIYVGCVAMSLAESLDASVVLFRRIKLKGNTKYIILAAALGKFVGNFIYFWKFRT